MATSDHDYDRAKGEVYRDSDRQRVVSLAEELAEALGHEAETQEAGFRGQTDPDKRHQDEEDDDELNNDLVGDGRFHYSPTSCNSGPTNLADDSVAAADVTKGQDVRRCRTGTNNSDQDVPETTPLLGIQDKGTGLATGKRKRGLLFISLVSLLFILADRTAEPVLEQYVYQVYTQQVYGNRSVKVLVTKTPCLNTSNTSTALADDLRDQVQDKSADLLSRLEILAFSVGALACLVLGTYSDVIGRRPLLLLPVIGHFVRDAFLPVMIHWDLGLPVLYAAYTVFGLGGATAGLLLGCYVYSADVMVTEKERTLGLAMVMASMGIAQAAMQYSAGVFIQQTGFFFPSLAASLCDVLTILIVVCLLPETVSRDQKKTLTPREGLRRIYAVFTARDKPYQRALMVILFVTFGIAASGDYASLKLDVLYLMDEPFCWSSSKIGLLESVKYGGSRVISLLLVLPLQKVLSTTWLCILGSCSFVACNVVTGLASTDLLLYVGAMSNMASTMMFAASRAMMSHMIPPDRQGALFGGLAVAESMCFGVSQLTFLNIYKLVLGIMPGLVYLVLGACYSLNILLFIVYGCLQIKGRRALLAPVTVQTEVVAGQASVQ